MAVSPDLLLNIKTPDSRTRPSSAKADAAAQASRQEASRFAEMYAKERQGKPVQQQEAPAKTTRDKPVQETDSQETAKGEAVQKPAVAESGNDLPLDQQDRASESADPTEAAEAELDPLLLLGMGTQAETEDPLGAAKPIGSEFLVGLQQAQSLSSAEQASLGDELMTEQKSLLQAQSAMQKAQMQAAGEGEQQPATEGDELFADLLLANSEAPETTDELKLELAFAASEQESADAPGETRQTNAELSASRLNPLSQAISQQAQQLQRPTLVPGQPVPMQQSGWSEAVVDRVMWLSSQNLKSAEIQLDPAELGRMEVRIDMTKEQTQITFLSPHASVREALEGQMHRLRDMFGQQGMTMDVNVSDQSLARGSQGEGSGESRNGARSQDTGGIDGESGGAIEIASNRASGDRGLVDYYA